MTCQVLNDTQPVARIQHACDDCYRTISPGEKYDRATLLDDDGLYTWKRCWHCRAFISLYSDQIAPDWYWDEGISVDDIREWEPDTPEAVEHKRQWEVKWRNELGELYPAIDRAGIEP